MKGVKGTRPICAVDGCDRVMHGAGYCRLHWERWRRNGTPVLPTVTERFFGYVDVADCWQWHGTTEATGYGRFVVGRKPYMAHRWVWEQMVGPIPEGHHLDHLCKNRLCVNPDHLEPVTPAVNNSRSASLTAKFARATHCIHGHEFTPENTYLYHNGRARQCKTCWRIRDREYRQRRKAVAA